MKIIFTIPSLYGGGAERVLKYLVENIDAKEKILLTLESGQKYDIKQSIEYIKLTNIDGRSSSLKKSIFFLIQYIKFIRFIKSEKPDVIISFLERTNIITILTPTKAKKIVSIRSFISKKFKDTGLKGSIVKFFYKRLFKLVKYFVVPTYEIKGDLINSFEINENKIKVIYNPIDLKTIDLLKKESLSDSEKEIFLNNEILINIGNLTHPKGQWHLIKVFSKIKTRNIKLLILGEGNYHDFLVEMAKKNSLKIYDYKLNDVLNDSYNIYFLGFQTNPYKYLYNSKLFLFSSLREGFPNALIEAMACNLPICSSDCQSGPKEILDYGKYGILLPVFSGNKNIIQKFNDIEVLWIEQINKLLNDKEKLKELEELSIQRVKDFELKNIILEWDNYLKGLNK